MNKQHKNVLVVGGGGYLGSVLVPLLLERDYRVIVLDRFFFGKEKLCPSLKNKNLILIKNDSRYFPKHILADIDVVFDLAALSNDPLSELYPQRTIEINFLARVRTAELAKEMGVKRYILASSCSVYGYQGNKIINEKTPPLPLTTYARANLLAEKNILPLHDKNFIVVSLRQGTLFGLSPRMRFDVAINQMTLSAFRDKTITLYGGNQWRPFLHVYDSARGFISIMEASQKKVNGQIFNLGNTAQNFKISDLAQLIAKTVNIPVNIIYQNNRDGRSYRVSFEKIKKTIDYKTIKTPEMGIREIYQALKTGFVKPSLKTITTMWYKKLLNDNPHLLDKTYTNLHCIICHNEKIIKYFSLGKQSPSNAYLEKKQLKTKEFKFPLGVSFCPKCHLAQLDFILDRPALFRHYAYFSSTSPQLLIHFDKYAEEVSRRFPKQTKKLVFEIASNDGLLLKSFKKRGARVLGIDPAENIAQQANKQGIKTIAKFFGRAVVPEILENYGKVGIITANNILAHTDEIHDVVAGVKQLLDKDGIFIFEVQYLADLLKNNEFDNTYHEHVFYFSLFPLIKLLGRYRLKIFDVRHVDTQGGSLRIYAGHTPLHFPVKKSLSQFLEKERQQGLGKIETYINFAGYPLKIKRGIKTILTQIKSKRKKIIGYGAAAKGNVLLQYCKIDSKILDYITDEAPSKQGKYTPGTHIPIVSPKCLTKEKPDYILLLAWNYTPSILEKEKWFIDQGGKFIIPIPRPYIFPIEKSRKKMSLD